jgi:glycosyltransferase involved in cell wall biosynthesis
MKILIDARFYGLENAGLGRYTMNLLDRLQAIDRTNSYFILLRKKYYENLHLAHNFEKVLAEIPHYSFKEQTEIPKIIKKINPDLTHFLHFNVPVNFREKFVVTIHDMTMHTQKTNATNLSLPIYIAKHFAYKKVFGSAIKNSIGIITPSQFVKDELIKNFKIKSEKVKVIYEGVSAFNSNSKNSFLRSRQNSWPVTSFSGNSNKLGELYFLYVGNAYPHKNLERAIEVFAKLKVNFYIVTSKNKFEKKLEELVSKLNAHEHVKFLGNVDDETLRNLYEKSVGFIYPSLSEGFGLQGLEAMQAGTIILCSNIQTFREIYGNHAIYFDPIDQVSIENAIQKTLEIKKLDAERMIRENKKFVLKYSWEKMAKEALEVYNSFK